MSEIRWYKGKYRVEIVTKSRMNYMVRALEKIPIVHSPNVLGYLTEFTIGEKFTTVPRLLWRHPR